MKEAIIQYNDDPDSTGGHMLISWKGLVRCKDCKHRNTIFCFKDEQGFGTDDDWYCADGEPLTQEVKA